MHNQIVSNVFNFDEYLICSDLHIRLETLELSERVLDTMINISNDREIPIIIAGDFFHTKAIIRSECLNLVLDKFNNLNHPVLMIVGNHDFENANCDKHALESLKYLQNVFIIDQFQCINNNKILLMSYCKDSVFKKNIGESKSEYLICHHGIAGFKMNNAKANVDSEINSNDVCKFKKIFAGHYHVAQKQGNVTYIGSPYQQNFGEAGQLKRFILFNVKTGKAEDIPLVNFPQYYIFKKTIDQVLDSGDCILSMQDEDHVRFDIVGSKSDCKQITKDLLREKYKIKGELKLKFDYDNVEEEVTIGDTLDYNIMFEKWLSFQRTKLDKTVLLKNGVEMINANI